MYVTCDSVTVTTVLSNDLKVEGQQADAAHPITGQYARFRARLTARELTVPHAAVNFRERSRCPTGSVCTGQRALPFMRLSA